MPTTTPPQDPKEESSPRQEPPAHNLAILTKGQQLGAKSAQKRTKAQPLATTTAAPRGNFPVPRSVAPQDHRGGWLRE